MKIAIVVAAHDGIVSLVTGVGVVVNSFVESFSEIKSYCKLFANNEVNLICLPPYLNKNSPDFNQTIKKISEDSCKITGGVLLDLPTFSDGASEGSVWGNCLQWKSASLSVAVYLKSIEQKYDKIILLANDTIFSAVRGFIPSMKNLNIIWIPHSLGRVFEDEFSNLERISFEEKSISELIKSDKDYIGYIGDSFKEVLIKKYLTPENKLLPFKNGLYLNSHRYKINENICKELLEKYNIPSDKKIIFSWGRCVNQKGYDVLIPACKLFLESNPHYYLVLLMPTETSPPEYVDKIKKELLQIDLDKFSAIYQFDEYLPYAILKSNNLDILAFPSRFEGEAITALEANALANNGVKIIYNPIPPNKERFLSNPLAIALTALNKEAILNALEYAKNFNKNEYFQTNKKGSDIVNNYSEGFNLIKNG